MSWRMRRSCLPMPLAHHPAAQPQAICRIHAAELFFLLRVQEETLQQRQERHVRTQREDDTACRQGEGGSLKTAAP